MVMIKKRELIEMILLESYNEKHVYHTTPETDSPAEAVEQMMI